MLLKPCKNNILVQFILPISTTTLVLADGRETPAISGRVKCKVLEVSKAVALVGEILPGSFLFLRPSPNHLIVEEKNYVSIIDASAVEALVLDDQDSEPSLS